MELANFEKKLNSSINHIVILHLIYAYVDASRIGISRDWGQR